MDCYAKNKQNYSLLRSRCSGKPFEIFFFNLITEEQRHRKLQLVLESLLLADHVCEFGELPAHNKKHDSRLSESDLASFRSLPHTFELLYFFKTPPDPNLLHRPIMIGKCEDGSDF